MIISRKMPKKVNKELNYTQKVKKYLLDTKLKLKKFCQVQLKFSTISWYTRHYVKEQWRNFALFSLDSLAFCFSVTQLIIFASNPQLTFLNVLAFGLALYMPKELIVKSFNGYKSYKLQLQGYNNQIKIQPEKWSRPSITKI